MSNSNTIIRCLRFNVYYVLCDNNKVQQKSCNEVHWMKNMRNSLPENYLNQNFILMIREITNMFFNIMLACTNIQYLPIYV